MKRVFTKCFENLDALEKELTYKNLYRVFNMNGDYPAVEWKLKGEIKQLSYSDMVYSVMHIADGIKSKLGDNDGKFVCLKLANCPEWFSVFWGILAAGYCPFLVDARHDEKLTSYFMQQSGSIAIISQEDFTYDGALSVKASDLIDLDKKMLLELAENADKTAMTFEERIGKYNWGKNVALCTSGTTSTAKIFVYDEESMCHQVLNGRQEMQKCDYLCYDGVKKNLCFLPLNHLFGFMANYIWYGFFGTTMVMPDKMAPSVLMQTCRDHHVTHVLAVPLLFNNLAKGLLQKIQKQSKFKQFMFKLMLNVSILAQRINTKFGIWLAKKMFGKSVLSQMAGTDIICMISGGGHVLPESLKIVNGIGYYALCGFGMTEVGVSSMEKRQNIKYRLRGEVGVPCDSVEYKIVPLNENDPTVGELVMRGSSLHSGMLKNGELTGPDYGEDGWFRTGDIGRLRDGSLTIEGRLKEIIVNESGENVYPDELEDTFLSIDGIKAFTVLGLAKPDSKLYEDIVIVAQVNADIIGNDELTEKLRVEIAARNATLPVYKKLQYALITADDLPLSNGIKIKRAVLKKQAEAGEGNFVKLEKVK